MIYTNFISPTCKKINIGVLPMVGKNSKWLLFILYFTFCVAHAAMSPDEVVRTTAEGVINHIESNRSVLEEIQKKFMRWWIN